MRHADKGMGKRDRMRCEKCGAEMNRHAAKLVEPRSADEAASADPALGGVIAEVHACPSCGGIKSVRGR